jgi:hypothetical protein
MKNQKSTAQPGTGKISTEDRRQVFLSSYKRLQETYSPTEIGLLMGLGHTQTRSELDRKVRDPDLPSHRRTTMLDALSIQLMVLLDQEGFDLAAFEFTDTGSLIRAPRRPR